MHMEPCMAHISEFDWVFPWGPGGVRKSPVFSVELSKHQKTCVLHSWHPRLPPHRWAARPCTLLSRRRDVTVRHSCSYQDGCPFQSGTDDIASPGEKEDSHRNCHFVVLIAWIFAPVVVDLNLDFVFKSHRFLLFRSQYQTFPTGDNSHDGGRISASLKVSKKKSLITWLHSTLLEISPTLTEIPKFT